MVRLFNCTEVQNKVATLCSNNDSNGICSQYGHTPMQHVVDLCTLSEDEIEDRICRWGFTEGFLTDDTEDSAGCYCDEVCVADYVWSAVGIFWAVVLFLSLSIVFMRWYRRKYDQPSDEKVEEILSRSRKDKPNPQLNNSTYSCFKWVPFATIILIYIIILGGGAALISQSYLSDKWTQWQTWGYIIAINMALFVAAYPLQTVVNGFIGLRKFEKAISDDRPMEQHDDVHHIVILPNYKEDPDMMRASIFRFLDQKYVDAKKNITIVLATEQREEGGLEKAMMLRDEFSGSFKEVAITRHPPLFGEQAGKASNSKWAFACLQKFSSTNKLEGPSAADDDAEGGLNYADPSINYTRDLGHYYSHPDLISTTMVSDGYEFDPNNTIVSLVDADALVHERMLSSINKSFTSTAGMKKHLLSWQGLTLFYENLDELDFINRSATFIQTLLKVADMGWIDLGIFAFEPKQPENTFHMSWRLLDLIDGGDNFVVPDEPHDLFKAMYLTEGHARVERICLPVSVYNVSNDDYMKGMQAKYKQFNRWLFGAPFEFTYWSGVYLNPNRPNLNVPFFEWISIIFSQIEKCAVIPSLGSAGLLYGSFGVKVAQSEYFHTIGSFMAIATLGSFGVFIVAMNYVHWRCVYHFNITECLRWPPLKKIGVGIFDSIVGNFMCIAFIIPMIMLKANYDVMTIKGVLSWDAEGRVEKKKKEEKKTEEKIPTQIDDGSYENEEDYEDDEGNLLIEGFEKTFSTRTSLQVSERVKSSQRALMMSGKMIAEDDSSSGSLYFD